MATCHRKRSGISRRFLARGGIVTRASWRMHSIALAEALNNIEEHAYSGRPEQPVLVEIDAARRLRKMLKSKTAGFLCRAASLPAGQYAFGGSGGALDEMPEGGFGWALLRRLTRELAYQRQKEWNRLTLCDLLMAHHGPACRIGRRGGAHKPPPGRLARALSVSAKEMPYCAPISAVNRCDTDLVAAEASLGVACIKPPPSAWRRGLCAHPSPNDTSQTLAVSRQEP
jgi:anti-sigma regulatory factor (Ser/Thr protein kinase)